VDIEWFANRATAEVRDQVRKRLNIASDMPVALFAGKLVPSKRPADLIRAAKLMKSSGREIAVLVAGSGPLETEMASHALAAGIPYYPLGFCNQTKMPQAYAASDVVVLPSDGHETWGLVANEALACGRSIVLSDAVGAAPDLVFDQTVGRVFPLGNIAALANAISTLIQQPPSLNLIAAKSAAYSPTVSANGILSAAEFAARTRNRQTL
jgi:glycosyltransferase involved in cell wall biosynthesis